MNLTETFTSKLGPFIARYLALKEALGRRYQIERAVLTHLDRFLAATVPRSLAAHRRDILPLVRHDRAFDADGATQPDENRAQSLPLPSAQ